MDPIVIWDGSFNNGAFDYIEPGVYDAAISIIFKSLKEGESFPNTKEKHLNSKKLMKIRKLYVFPPDAGEVILKRKYLFESKQSGDLYRSD